MPEVQIIKVNKLYPLKLPDYQGAIAEFLKGGTDTLLIFMPEIKTFEVKSVTKGKIKCGFLNKNNAILFIWQFFDNENKPIFTFESPFNANLYSSVSIPEINTANNRLFINIHLVDSYSGIVRGLRALTMPPELTQSFFTAVKNQINSLDSGREQQYEWIKLAPTELIALSKNYTMGE